MKLVFKVEPEYSEEAREAKHQGTVVLAIQVGEDGRATIFGSSEASARAGRKGDRGGPAMALQPRHVQRPGRGRQSQCRINFRLL